MGVQKRRVSHARQGDRRSHHALSTPDLEACPHCHEPKRVHHACPTCGWYAGREAVRIKPRTKPEQPAS
jgi:large subunit ribosomal protein L32